MTHYSSAGNLLNSQTAIIKSGPNAGGTTTVHRRANPVSDSVEASLALNPVVDREEYLRRQAGMLVIARDGAAREEAARFAGLVIKRWSDAETAYFRLDEKRFTEDGEQTVTVTLRDQNGDDIDEPWLDQTPESTLARFDQGTLRGLHRKELNIAELVAENHSGTSNFHGRIFAAEAEIASASLAEYCDDITRAWPDADTVTFTLGEDHDGNPMLQVLIEDIDGAEVSMGNDAQDRFDRIEYQAVKRFDADTIDMKAAAAWQPGDEPLG